MRIAGDFTPQASRALSNQEATEWIRSLWMEGQFIASAYAEMRMEQRDFSDADVAFLLMTFGVKSHRKVDGSWRYKISGKSVDGKPMAAVFEIEGNLMTLVTVHER
jgi:hypothetical protein